MFDARVGKGLWGCAALPRQSIVNIPDLWLSAACDTKQNESVGEKLVFPVYFYFWERGVKSSFLPWSEISWKRPDNQILCGFLCILQLFIHRSLGGQLVLSRGEPSAVPHQVQGVISFFSARIASEEGSEGASPPECGVKPAPGRGPAEGPRRAGS